MKSTGSRTDGPVSTLPKYFWKQISRNGFTAIWSWDFAIFWNICMYYLVFHGICLTLLYKSQYIMIQHSPFGTDWLQHAVNPLVEICFQKYFGRVITIASTLDPVVFVVPKLISMWWNFGGIIFSPVCYNYMPYLLTFRCQPTCRVALVSPCRS